MLDPVTMSGLISAGGAVAGGLLGRSSGPQSSRWYRDALKDMYGDASAIAGMPYQPYTGERIAGLTPDELSAFDLIRGNVGSWEDLMSQASSGLGAAAAYQPGTVSSNYTAPTDFGTNYTAPTSFGQDHVAPTSMGVSYAAPGSVGSTYTAPTNFGTNYTAPTNMGSSYTAPTSIGTNYSAPTSFGQEYSVPTEFGQAYSAPTSMGDDFSYQPGRITSTYQAPTSMGSDFNYTPLNVSAPGVSAERIKEKSFLDYDVNKYMNPFISGVIDTSMADIEKQRLMAENSNKADMMAANAWGGSRSGVAQGVTNEGYADAAARTAANLRMAGYESAAGKIMQDANRNLDAAKSNQSAALQAGITTAQLGVQAQIANQAAGLDAAKFGANYGLNRDIALDDSRRFASDLDYRIGSENERLALDAAKYGAGYSLDRDTALEAARQFGAGYSLEQDVARNAANQFGADYSLRQDIASDASNQFAANYSLDQGRTLELARQFEANYGLEQDKALELAQQFGANYSLQQSLAADDASRFASTYSLDQDRLLELSRQFEASYGLDQDKALELAKEFASSYSLDRDVAADDSSRFAATNDLNRDIAADSAARYENTSNLDASQFNVTSDMNANNSRVNANLGLADIAGATSQLGYADSAALLDAGQTQRSVEQAQLEADYMEYLREQGWDEAQLSWLQGFLKDPKGVAGQYPQQNSALGILGGALAGSNIASDIYNSLFGSSAASNVNVPYSPGGSGPYRDGYVNPTPYNWLNLVSR